MCGYRFQRFGTLHSRHTDIARCDAFPALHPKFCHLASLCRPSASGYANKPPLTHLVPPRMILDEFRNSIRKEFQA